MGLTISDQIQNKGFSGISQMEQEIASSIENTDAMNQVDLIALQQKTAAYSNTIAMMSTMLKHLADTDKEVIRNT